MTKTEWIVDFIIQLDVIDLLDQTKEFAGFYLVEKGTKQYLVKVINEFVVTNELTEKVKPKSYIRLFRNKSFIYVKGRITFSLIKRLKAT